MRNHTLTIGEGVLCDGEWDTMLSVVLKILGGIPFKPHLYHDAMLPDHHTNCHTNVRPPRVGNGRHGVQLQRASTVRGNALFGGSLRPLVTILQKPCVIDEQPSRVDLGVALAGAPHVGVE